tara:strand:- start:2200 stop:2403 length:204 start_codon:yes stop_codon:yes gene_type:complete
MTYTVIYKDQNDDSMGTFTFISKKHDKNYAWIEFKKEYATCNQEPIAMIPGHAVVYFSNCISPVDFE